MEYLYPSDVTRRMAQIKRLRAALKEEYKILKAQTLTIRFTEENTRTIKDAMYRADLYGKGDDTQFLMDTLHSFLD